MATTLIRSRAALLPTKGRYQVETVPDGAVLQEDGIIAAGRHVSRRCTASIRTPQSSAPGPKSCCRAS